MAQSRHLARENLQGVVVRRSEHRTPRLHQKCRQKLIAQFAEFEKHLITTVIYLVRELMLNYADFIF